MRRAALVGSALILFWSVLVVSAPWSAATTPTSDALCPTLPCVAPADVWTVDQDNDAMDPGFEKTPAAQLPASQAWQDSGAGNPWNIATDDTNAHRGSRVASRAGDGTSSTRNLGNQFLADAKENEKWAISGWFRSVNANHNSMGEVLLQWFDKSGTQLATNAFATAHTNSEWKLVTGQATAPAGAESVRGVFVVTKHSAGTWYADDLVVRLKTTLTGFGLNATNDQRASTLNVDRTQVQSRVNDGCVSKGVAAGISKIHQDGSVECSAFQAVPIDWTIQRAEGDTSFQFRVFEASDPGGNNMEIDLRCDDIGPDGSTNAQVVALSSYQGLVHYSMQTTRKSSVDVIPIDQYGSAPIGDSDVFSNDRSNGGFGQGTIFFRTPAALYQVDLSWQVRAHDCLVLGTGLVLPATVQQA